MRRVAGIVMAVAVLAALGLVVRSGGGGGDGTPTYWMELDSAFGLIRGGDVKVAGVRAGKIGRIRLDRRTLRARVQLHIEETGFGSLRADVRCSVRLQSLIGEYFVDCLPGTARRRWPQRRTIPVERTASTVAPDLVANVMRRPYRERLRIIIGSLGAGVAGNSESLNAALRRAVPALRNTDEVLAKLARQNRVLADLVRDGDVVIGDLAGNRRDVGRWVEEARDTSRASAERRADIAAGLRRLPRFLRELRPTMRELGAVADAGTPALRNLEAASGRLERFLEALPPFAEASAPAIDALGEAGERGRAAVRAATPVVDELDRYARGAPELGRNLAAVLEHLDDRDHAVEEDPRSPGGRGYTGLEALLQYVYDQTLSTNIHDGTVHYLKATPFEGRCAPYADVKAAKEEGAHCAQSLGPNLPGITYVDHSAPAGYDGADRSHGPGDERRRGGRHDRPAPPVGDGDGGSRAGGGEAGARGDGDGGGDRAAGGERGDSGGGGQGARPAPPIRVPGLEDLLPSVEAPAPGPPQVPEVPRPVPRGDDSDKALLDFLLGS